MERKLSSRFLVWPQPLSYPGYDLINRDTSPGDVFDLGIEMSDYSGGVYLAVPHVIEMAQHIGMATVEEADAMRQEIADLKAQINRLPKAEENLKDGIDSLVSQFLVDLHSDEPDVVVPQPEPEPIVRVLEEAERETVGPLGFKGHRDLGYNPKL